MQGSAIAGRNVRRTGEDVPIGADLVPAGSPVTPAVVGLAAAVGLDTLAVRPRPAVALLVTGDELVGTGSSADGLVRDALGPALPGWVNGLGGGRYRQSGYATPIRTTWPRRSSRPAVTSWSPRAGSAAGRRT